MTQDEIYNKVQQVLVDALGVDEDEIKPDAALMDDLGAESIDFLDIQFRLEKAFGIKIPKGDLTPEGLTNNPEFVQGGKFTERGLQEVATRMPLADITPLKQDAKVENMSKLFTVEFITKYIASKVG
jgi:acyl carrier protein